MLAVLLTSICLGVMPYLFIPPERTHKVRNTGVGGVCSIFRILPKKKEKNDRSGRGLSGTLGRLVGRLSGGLAVIEVYLTCRPPGTPSCGHWVGL